MTRVEIEAAYNDWTAYQNVLTAELKALFNENPAKAMKDRARRARIKAAGIALAGAILKQDALLVALVELHNEELKNA